MPELNRHVARLNTDQGKGVASRKAVVAAAGSNKVIIYQDSVTQESVVEVRDGSGAIVATAGRVLIALGDLVVAPSGYREAKFREFIFKNADDECRDWHCWILMTEPKLKA